MVSLSLAGLKVECAVVWLVVWPMAMYKDLVN